MTKVLTETEKIKGWMNSKQLPESPKITYVKQTKSNRKSATVLTRLSGRLH